MSLILKAYLENQEALKRFLRQFFPRSQDAEDIAQEAFVRAYSAEHTQDLRAPRAFLFRVAKNLALDERAKHSRTKVDYLEDFGSTAVLEDIEQAALDDQVNKQQVMDLLAEALKILPSQCRHVFVLHRIEGLSHKEIAHRLGISTSTVEKHVAAGLLKCAHFMQSQGYNVRHGRFQKKGSTDLQRARRR